MENNKQRRLLLLGDIATPQVRVSGGTVLKCTMHGTYVIPVNIPNVAFFRQCFKQKFL